MQALVTGCAGFIGSRLTDTLLARGVAVRGIDAFTTYYDPAVKHANVSAAQESPRFELIDGDLNQLDLPLVLDGVDVVYHLAGQPGVRVSWSDGFSQYVTLNVLATQRLLEATRQHPVPRLVYASSSSIYGNAVRYPTTEADVPHPHSPYGVTKLAAEHLCSLYADNWGVPTVSLRYFSVYGPRQRPDMGFSRFFDAIQSGRPLPIYGTGRQIRDFTFVGDVVDATIAAGTAGRPRRHGVQRRRRIFDQRPRAHPSAGGGHEPHDRAPSIFPRSPVTSIARGVRSRGPVSCWGGSPRSTSRPVCARSSTTSARRVPGWTDLQRATRDRSSSSHRAVTTSISKWRSACARAAAPSPASDARPRSSPRASASASSGGTRIPVTPSSTMSATYPTSVATIG